MIASRQRRGSGSPTLPQNASQVDGRLRSTIRSGAASRCPRHAAGADGMARIVLGIATSHTPMLNTPAKDWPSFIDRDGVRDFLDKEGEPATYAGIADAVADPRALPELTPERFAARHDEAQAAVEQSEAERAPRRARRADHRRRRPEGAVPRGPPAGDPRLLRRHDPQRAALAQLQGPGMVAARHRALLRGEGAARLPGRRHAWRCT